MEGYFERQSVPVAVDPQIKLPPALKGAFDSNSRNQQILEKIQFDWKQQGLKLELSNMDWKAYLKELKTNPPQIFRMGWLAAFPDPISHLQALTSKNPNNLTGWTHPRYDALVSEIEKLEPGQERAAKIIEAQTLLLDRECPVVPLFHYVQTHAVSGRVQNFAVNGMGVIRWQELNLKDQ